MIYWNFNYR